MRRALAIAAILASTPALAKGLHRVAELGGPDAKLFVGWYEAEGKRVAIIGIDARGHKNSIAFDQIEFASFVELCEKAGATRGASLEKVGELGDTGTRDPSRISVEAGQQGLRFTISSAGQGSVNAAVAATEVRKLLKANVWVQKRLREAPH